MTLIVGTQADAAIALSGMGREIGHGIRRTAYLVNDVIYKIARYWAADSNVREYDNYLNWLSIGLPGNVFLPDTYLWRVDGIPVIAMEFIRPGIENDDEELAEEYCSMLEEISGDVHPDNIVINDEGCWLIDMEF